MTRPLIIDTQMHGRPGITGAFLVRGERTALVESGPKSSIDHVLSGLESEGVTELDWIVVTHIHLDHAGAAGALAQRFPGARVAVHEVGAPHLADPSKLWSSASRIYGDEMERLWGGIDPIDPDRIHVLRDGDKIDLGGRSLQAVDTPGHAGHHHTYLDDATGIAFTGDALGVRLPDVGIMRPATPPPEFNLDVAIDSIRRIQALGASSLWLTHYGPCDEGTDATDVDGACERAIEALRTWGSWIEEAREKTGDIDEVTDAVRSKVASALGGRIDSEALDRMEQTTSYRMNTWGYMRYFDKRSS
ncbi:MAG: MBL fold metallo-hydrolase [Actinomycetota bacterium]